MLLSPFSAPFGGFHFRNEQVYTTEIDAFLIVTKGIFKHELDGMRLEVPPDLYHPTINAKTISSFIRGGFTSFFPEITGWVILVKFPGDLFKK